MTCFDQKSKAELMIDEVKRSFCTSGPSSAPLKLLEQAWLNWTKLGLEKVAEEIGVI